MDIFDIEFFLFEGKKSFSPQEQNGTEYILLQLVSTFPKFDTYTGVLAGGLKVVIFGKYGKKGQRKPAFAIYGSKKNTPCYFGLRFDDKALRSKINEDTHYQYNKQFTLGDAIVNYEDEFKKYLEELSSIKGINVRMKGNSENEFLKNSKFDGNISTIEDTLEFVKRRRGQPKFRQTLIEVFDKKCAATGCSVIGLLEAAHIVPHKDLVNYEPSNGLLLRTDIHTLFDLGMLKIKPDGKIEIEDTLMQDSHYKEIQGRKIFFPRLANKEIDKFRAALLERYQKVNQ